MNLKEHILQALAEQLESWDSLISSIDEQQLSFALKPSIWTIRDVIVHLWAWQQRSVARLDAAVNNRMPKFPQWAPTPEPALEDDTDYVNDWIYTTYREKPWADVYADWKATFQRVLELGGAITEKDLLNDEKYPWLEGSPIVLVLLGTYDHHREHLEDLLSWFSQYEPGKK